MLYLLAAFWEWFAVALFIGLVVGFLTTTRDEDAQFSGHGVTVTAVFIVAGGFLLANLQTVPGRAGLALETALLVLSAYGLGLPLGGGARLLVAAASPPPVPAKRKPPHIVVRGKPREEASSAPPPPEPAPEAPPPAAAPARAVEPTQPTIAAAPSDPAPAPAASPPPAASKKLPGSRPEGLSQPRGGTPDDLGKIKGIGPKSVEKLHALGVYHFDQIAAWTPENIKYVSASLAVPGRIERGRWVAQAKEFAGLDRAAEAGHVSAQAK